MLEAIAVFTTVTGTLKGLDTAGKYANKIYDSVFPNMDEQSCHLQGLIQILGAAKDLIRDDETFNFQCSDELRQFLDYAVKFNETKVESYTNEASKGWNYKKLFTDAQNSLLLPLVMTIIHRQKKDTNITVEVIRSAKLELIESIISVKDDITFAKEEILSTIKQIDEKQTKFAKQFNPVLQNFQARNATVSEVFEDMNGAPDLAIQRKQMNNKSNQKSSTL
jgi:hypothetical protein